MSTNKIVKFVLAATAASLMLGAASGPSFAQHHPGGGVHPRPTCDASCQAKNAMPPAKLQPGKSTAAPNTGGGKNIRPQ